MSRPRFDQLPAVVPIAASWLIGAALLWLGHLLRAVDDNLADLGGEE